MRRTSLITAGTAFAAVVLVVSAVVALGAIPSSGLFTGCYNTKNGDLRLIDKDAGQACTAKEGEVTWGQQGPQGPAGPTLGWYKQMDWAAPTQPDGLPLVQTMEGSTVLQINLPNLDQGSAYFGSATFELVNHGTVDAAVNCNVGNQMGHELFVPVNQVSDPSQGGVWGSNVSTFTLTGMSTFDEMRFECHITNWQGQGSAPNVRIRRASLEATYISLEDQTPTP